MKNMDLRTAFLLSVVFIDMIGFGLIFPVMPDLIMEIEDVSVSRAAEVGGILLFLYAAMQFLFAPLIGGLSDRFGRRPVLLVSLAMLGLNYCIMAVAPTLEWLYVGRVLCGITGATWAAASAAMADTTNSENRSAAFGLLSGVGALGYLLGPAFGGVLGEIDTRMPFIFAAGLAFTGAFVGYFLLRESLPSERRREFRLSRANPFGTLMRFSTSSFVIKGLAAVFCIQMAGQALLSTWPYWGELRFDWGAMEAGLSVSLYGLLIAFVQIFLIGRVNKLSGPAMTAILGGVFSLVSYLIIASAPSQPFVVIAIIIAAFSGLTFPSLQSMMVANVEEDSQGELQGAIASTTGLTAVIGPLIMTGIFVRFTEGPSLYFPGAPFLLSSIFVCAALFALVLINAETREQSKASKLGEPSRAE